jgi:ubiquinone/menaquinone biosynthesis C-methylase UbiE
MNGTEWVDPANVDQLRAWDTEEGVRWAAQADLFEAALQRYDDWLLRAARINDGDQVLDLGCGSGSTTRAAAWLVGSGSALGMDLSSPLLAVAERKARAAGLTNVRFVQADAQIHPFADDAFDGVISRTGCMFFADPLAAFSNVARAIRPGGRLALLVWQPAARNNWFTSIGTALSAGRELPAPPVGRPGPFSMAEPSGVRRMLVEAGFAEPEFESIEELMYFGPDDETAERFVLGALGWLLDPLDPPAREQALRTLRADLAAHQTPEGVAYPSATWLITSHPAR